MSKRSTHPALIYFNALTMKQREKFLEKIGMTDNSFRVSCSKGVNLSPSKAMLVESASSGAISRKVFRSDWAEIWPRLKK